VFRSGFVSILGRPNAGKSTLLNALIGEKLAIVASKPQTTRTAVQGVLNLPGAQIVLVDTPGIHESDSLINRRMMDTVRTAAQERDALVFVASAEADPGEEDSKALSVLDHSPETPAILALNKVDRLPRKDELLPRLDKYRALRDFAEFVPISAMTGDGLDQLKQAIVARLPEGKRLFPLDYLTDQPQRFLVAEIVREKILELTRQEVPHSVAVIVDAWDEKNKMTRIHASVVVEREGQKKIIIGTGASMIKQIGSLARQDIERLLDSKVHLELFVKVRPNWREDPQFLAEIDPRSMAGL
jgi:GTP-binding protein Era